MVLVQTAEHAETRLKHEAWYADDYSRVPSANEDGLYTFLGEHISCVGDGYHPWPVHYYKQIREEIDPDFVLLWVNKAWKSPNEGVFKTHHYMLARYVLHPRTGVRPLGNLLLPTFKVAGWKVKNPILEAYLMDGHDPDDSSAAGRPGRFVPFDGSVVSSMRKAMWKRNNKRQEDRIRENNALQAEAAEKAQKAVLADVADDAKDNSYQIKKSRGQSDRVYVSDTLRAVAGEAA